jgi:hypothetical protein
MSTRFQVPKQDLCLSQFGWSVRVAILAGLLACSHVAERLNAATRTNFIIVLCDDFVVLVRNLRVPTNFSVATTGA